MLIAWQEFIKGKRKRKDVQEFQLHLIDNILSLHLELKNKAYNHGSYLAFNISDPKPRNIHKASVQDRLLHHAIYRILYPYFDKKFIFDSYSCRLNKGTHRALNRFNEFSGKVSRNHTRICYVLKCDVRKFFASIDHDLMNRILSRYIKNKNIGTLLAHIIESFQFSLGKGLPLGNLTSQLLVNIYMHEFDLFIKQELKVKYYIRYADDFVILSDDNKYLEEILPKITKFLEEKLKLTLHEDKLRMHTYNNGVDFLGWVHFPYHRVIRTSTKNKIIRMTKWYPKRETINSYRNLLKYGNTYKLRNSLKIFI